MKRDVPFYVLNIKDPILKIQNMEYGSKLKTFKKSNIKWDYDRVVYSLNFVITGSIVDTNCVRLVCVFVVFGYRPLLHLNWEYYSHVWITTLPN